MKKKTKNRVKILEGAFVGAVFGVTAGILLAKKSAKKTNTDIKKLSGDFYRYIAPKVKKLKNVSEEQYNDFISQSAENFAKIKKISLSEKKILTSDAKRSWNRIKKYLS